MAGTLQINTESLRQVGSGLQRVSQELEGAINELEAYVRGLGDSAWGNDDIGQLIGVAFDEVVTFAFECLREVLAEILDSASDLAAMADRYDAAEQQFIQRFRQLGESLGF
jgi:ABC-type transporter Mla subunit MlaD